jgi:hypothetical protein
VRFAVTPLGGGRADAARVVDAIVRYLQPPPKASGPAPPAADGATSGPERYYADRGEEAGRWLGRGAARAGLAGTVEREDFASVLAGRDPHSGERLISAQGSAGRRASLGSGTHARLSPEGERLYSPADVAVVLGLTHAEVERLLDVGAALAVARIGVRGAAVGSGDAAPPAGYPARYPAGSPAVEAPQVRTPAGSPVRAFDHPLGQPASSYLVPVINPDGSRWVSDHELGRCEHARAQGVDPDEIRSIGHEDDQLSLVEAARLGRWLVTREHLAEFLERRRPPARCASAYDLTLTTEKSLGVLALLGDDGTGRRACSGRSRPATTGRSAGSRSAAVGRIDGQPVAARG